MIMTSRQLAPPLGALRPARALAMLVLALAAGPLCAQPAPPAGASTAPLEAGFAEAARTLENDPRFDNTTDQHWREMVDFVAGNVLFALVHEVGHAIISDMGLPVLGHEEDAADAFATLTRLRMGNDFSIRVLSASAMGWFMSDKRNRERHVPNVFYGEHSLDRQRAFNIVCLMVGSDPDKFKHLADIVKLPEDRQGSCQGDFSNASWSWRKLLEPHLRTAEQPKMKFEVVYGDGGQYKTIEKFLRQTRILEVVADRLSDRFKWRAPIGFEARLCDSPTASWDLTARKIYICYELAFDYAELYRDYGDAGKPAPPRRRVR
jgi:hypothetical protein